MPRCSSPSARARARARAGGPSARCHAVRRMGWRRHRERSGIRARRVADASLAIVPSGSGNGLARELGIPLDPASAFQVVFEGRSRLIDVGELDGRLFFNIAGLGLDATSRASIRRRRARASRLRSVSRTCGPRGRVLRAHEYAVTADGHDLRVRPLLIALANARQYGNGALIAPGARTRRRQARSRRGRSQTGLAGADSGAAAVLGERSRRFRECRSRGQAASRFLLTPRSCTTSMGSHTSGDRLSRPPYIHGLCA